MAAMAQEDQKKRKVVVKRTELLTKLQENLERHVADYEEAMAGYKSVLLEKVDQAFEEAKKSLAERHEQVKTKIAKFNDADIAKQRDYFTLIDSVSVEMKVPRSYAAEYESAIDIARWDVNENLELSYAEFTCFVRDEWDWKSGFDAVSMLYKGR